MKKIQIYNPITTVIILIYSGITQFSVFLKNHSAITGWVYWISKTQHAHHVHNILPCGFIHLNYSAATM